MAEKIHRGQRENALKGKDNGGGIPLGYVLGKNQKLEIATIIAPIVLEIFILYADGETMKVIIDDLNSRGLKTKRQAIFSK